MSAILLQSLIIRKGGTVVEMKDGTTYHFKDDGLGNHIAAIANMDHVQTLIQIPEGYRIFSTDPGIPADPVGIAAKVAPIPAPAPAQTPAPAPVVPVVPVPTPAPEPAEAKKIEPAPAPAQAPLDPEADIDALRAIFRTEVGREPSARAKAETLVAQIEAVRAERATS